MTRATRNKGVPDSDEDFTETLVASVVRIDALEQQFGQELELLRAEIDSSDEMQRSFRCGLPDPIDHELRIDALVEQNRELADTVATVTVENERLQAELVLSEHRNAELLKLVQETKTALNIFEAALGPDSSDTEKTLEDIANIVGHLGEIRPQARALGEHQSGGRRGGETDGANRALELEQIEDAKPGRSVPVAEIQDQEAHPRRKPVVAPFDSNPLPADSPVRTARKKKWFPWSSED